MMKIFVTYCVLLIALTADAKVRELPSFFKTCKLNDPNMSQCMIDKAKLSLPGLLPGVKEFKVPSFLPLKLKEVKVDAGNIILKLSDFDMYGLDSTELTEVVLDEDKRNSRSKLHMKQLQVNGTYDIDGKILVLPIKGHGPAFLKFDNLIVDLEFHYDLIEDPDEKQYHYMKLTKLIVDYTVEKAFFKFDNLFNGDKTLGDEMNKFLNENWQEFHKDLRPAIIDVIQTVILQITKGILELVPIENMFPS